MSKPTTANMRKPFIMCMPFVSSDPESQFESLSWMTKGSARAAFVHLVSFMWIPSRGKVVYCIGETAQRPKVYLIKAIGFNSQQIASASSVDIATGDTPET